jgi:hypothetical protein
MGEIFGGMRLVSPSGMVETLAFRRSEIGRNVNAVNMSLFGFIVRHTGESRYPGFFILNWSWIPAGVYPVLDTGQE